jgi:hypothetical protein
MTISGVRILLVNFCQLESQNLADVTGEQGRGIFMGISRKFCMPSSNVPRHLLAALMAPYHILEPMQYIASIVS